VVCVSEKDGVIGGGHRCYDFFEPEQGADLALVSRNVSRGVTIVVSVEPYDIGGPARYGGVHGDYAACGVRDRVRVVGVAGPAPNDDARVLEVYSIRYENGHAAAVRVWGGG
jgi:hypothetical protein